MPPRKIFPQTPSAPQLNGEITLNISQPHSYTPSSLMEWGLMGLELTLQYRVNDHNLVTNIQDPYYMAIGFPSNQMNPFKVQ